MHHENLSRGRVGLAAATVALGLAGAVKIFVQLGGLGKTKQEYGGWVPLDLGSEYSDLNSETALPSQDKLDSITLKK